MPWWSWLLIWSSLVLGLFGMLVWFAFRLFRKALATGAALGDLSERVAAVGQGSETPEPARFRSAVLQEPGEVYLTLEIGRIERAQRHQRRRDSLVARGKLLITRPLTQRTDTDA